MIYFHTMPFDTSQPHPELLLELVTMRMPFGKYKDRLLCDLPDHYLEWFQREGFPKGKLGILLETMHVIKLNGLSYLLDPLKKSISLSLSLCCKAFASSIHLKFNFFTTETK
jgi:uncharacterized protein (DUF3820 family)